MGKRSSEAKERRGSTTVTAKPHCVANGTSACAMCTAPTTISRSGGLCACRNQSRAAELHRAAFVIAQRGFGGRVQSGGRGGVGQELLRAVGQAGGQHDGPLVALRRVEGGEDFRGHG